MAEKFLISFLLKAIDQMTPTFAKVSRGLKRMYSDLGETEKRFGRFSAVTKRMGEQLKNVGSKMTMAVTAPIVGAGVGMIAAAVGAEDAFALVRKTVTATEPQFAELKTQLRGLSEQIPIATNDLYSFAGIAGQLGIDRGNIVGFTDTIARLGATTNIAGEEAALMLGQFANIVQLDQSKFQEIGNIIVRLGNTMGTTEDKIVSMAFRLAGLKSIVGLSEADIFGLAAAMSSVGIEAEAGGTAMTQVFSKMKEAAEGLTKDAKKTLPLFAKLTGQSVKTFASAYKRDAIGTVLKFIATLRELKERGAPVITILDRLTMDGVRISDSLNRASGAGEKFTRGLALANDELIQNNAMLKESNQRFRTTGSQIKIFWNVLKNMAADFGDTVTPALRSILEAIKPMLKWFGGLSDETKKFMVTLGLLAASIGPALIALGMLATSLSIVSIAGGPVTVTAMLIAAAIVGISVAVAGLIIWLDDLKLAAASAMEWVRDLINMIPDWMFQKGSGLDRFRKALSEGAKGLRYDVALKAPVKALEGATDPASRVASRLWQDYLLEKKSQTDINLKVSADPGTSALVMGVDRKHGDAKVAVDTIGYAGTW